MYRRLEQLLALPPGLGLLDHRLALLVQRMLLIFLAGSLISAPLWLTATGPTIGRNLLIVLNLGVISSTILGLWLIRSGRVQAALNLTTAMLLAAISLALYVTGTRHGYALMFGFALVLALVSLVPRRFALRGVAVIIGSVITVIAVLETREPPLAGLLPDKELEPIDIAVAISMTLAPLVLFLRSSSNTLAAAVTDLNATNQALAVQLAERAQTEQALRASEERYRLIAENSHDLICVLDATPTFRYVSPSFLPTLGYTPEMLIGTPAFALAHPDDLAAIQQSWAALKIGANANVTFRFHHKNGDWRWFEAMGKLVLTEQEPLAVIVGRDITERLRLEQQLRESQRMESLGQLAGGIAHDFNNLLQIIRGRTELAAEILTSDHDAHADLIDALAATRRAANLVRQLLVFARRQPMIPQLIDVSAVLHDLGPLLLRAAGSSVELSVKTAPDLWPIRSDPAQIEQLLTNLVLNARDALGSGGTIWITLTNTLVGASSVSQHPELHNGPHVLLLVRDSGSGMSEATRQRALDPFFSTKPAGENLGLGLAICYGIVRQCEGALWLESTPGEGTTVRIYLPAIVEGA